MTPAYTSVRILAACFILGIFSAVGAQAETRAPWRIQASKQCDAPFCSILFPVVAANRRVELENVSCFTTTTFGPLLTLTLSTTPAPVLFHYPSNRWERTFDDDYYISFSEPTGIFATAGQRFIVEAQADSLSGGDNTFVTCALYGDLVFLP